MERRKPAGFSPNGPTNARNPSGAGGGQKKKKPKTDKESGSSNSYAKLVGAVSEGPIEGVIRLLEGVYLDETPVQNPDGTKNFEGVLFEQRLGLRVQPPIAGFTDDVSSETGVGVEVKHQLPVTRSLTNANIDSIKVRLGFQLQRYKSDGGIRKLSMEFKIFIKEGAGPFVERYHNEINERFSSLTEFEYEFPVNNMGGTVTQFQIRVERLTGQDSDTNEFQRTMMFRAFGESIAAKLIYPFTAYCALQFEASQFNSLPQVSFKLGGRLIKIPSNARVAADRGLDYSGVWDGTFIEAPIACSDPAWIFYDICINNVYGLGNRVKADKLDKWSLYSLSKYCNELMIIGKSGGEYNSNVYERRYSCNTVISDKRGAWELLDAIRSIFRGYLFWLGGVVTLEADRPGTPSMIVTQADVVEGSFTYSLTPRRALHTIAHITWVNPENFYRQEVETVTDHIGVERYGVRRLEASAFGCTSRYQAHRLGWAYLISDRLERETVRFRMRAYGAYAKPGMIIKVMDTKETIARFSGLVDHGTTTAVTLDHPITIEAGLLHSITVMLPDGRLADRAVTNGAGTHLTLNLAAPLPYPPEPDAPWLVSNPIVQPGEYRIISIIPVAEDDLLVYEVSALQYVDEKYSKIDTDYYVPPVPPVPRPPAVPPLPIKPLWQIDSTPFGFLLAASWKKPENSDFVSGYLARFRAGVDEEWTDPINVSYTAASWDVLEDSEYEVEVASADIYGNTSAWVRAERAQYPSISLNYGSGYSLMF